MINGGADLYWRIYLPCVENSAYSKIYIIRKFRVFSIKKKLNTKLVEPSTWKIQIPTLNSDFLGVNCGIDIGNIDRLKSHTQFHLRKI